MTVRMPKIGRIPPNVPAIFRERFLKYDLPRILGMFKDEFISTLKAIEFELDPSNSRYILYGEVVIGLPDMEKYSRSPDYYYNYVLLCLIHEIGHHAAYMIALSPEGDVRHWFWIIGEHARSLVRPAMDMWLMDMWLLASEAIAAILEVRGARRLGIPERMIRRVIYSAYKEAAYAVFILEKEYGDKLEKIVFK